ncbi:unnamed protein product [Polarella glacialis]|uniref:Uncharacterized protein n=1 Tax=Polarella glacialis TaxID=89957 RepID=A0A813KVH0_POLGL|nr:unnamed protein product [Polarella glacialis]CAE8713740.1 unnamed protein product [Polarella glacialis]
MGLSKRMGAEIANVVSFLGLGTSLFTIILGLVYVWYHPPSFKLMWDECGWTDPDEYTLWVDCNASWTSSWGLTGLPKFVPLLMGITGSVMHRPVLLQVMGFPKNFLQYGIWLIVQGIFANFGYDGKLGVINGWLSIFLGFTCVVCQVFGLKTDRMLELTGESALNCANTKAADSNENADEDVKDHTALAIISCFFFPPTGIFALLASRQAAAANKSGDRLAARKSRGRAITLMQFSLALGVIVIGSSTIISVTNGKVAPPAAVEDYEDYDFGDDDGDGDVA